MKAFLRILTVVAMAFSVACHTDKPTPEPPQPDNKVEGTFHFSNEIVSQRRLKVDITTDNPDMEYVVLLAEKKYFVLNNIDTRDELLEDDYNYISELARVSNKGIYDTLTNLGILTKGDREGYLAINLYPGTEYIVYCYGVECTDDSFRVTTEVCYIELTTNTPEMQSVDFDINTTVNGNIADITIEPTNYDGYYYYYLVPEDAREYLEEGKEMDTTYIELFSNRTFDIFNNLINNNGIAKEEFCPKGKSSFTERVKPNTRYMVVAFAVNEEQLPLLCSVPDVAYFTAGELTKSELTLDVKVTDITPYNAQLSITPSNNEESFACVFISGEQEPKNVDDYNKMMLIINQFDPAIFTGELFQALTPLMPLTEYVVLAFGIDTFNDLPTTDLYEVRFTSGEATDGKIEITSIELLKLFDTNAIIAIDPSYAADFRDYECVGIVEAKTNIACDKLYFWWYETWMKIEYEEEAFLEDLLMYPYADNPEAMEMYYSLNNDDTFFFAGIAEDEDGNLSEIFYGEDFLLTEDMVSPAEEFFEIVSRPSKSRVIFKR
ncbi:MAG: hypothetical protein J6R90_00115 [Alistipes sp.]|nr:hypothetical protein [Alistipes sp.]